MEALDRPTMVDGDFAKLREFVQLTERKRELEKELADVKEALVDLEAEVLRIFESQGIERITVDGMTLFLRRELWASKREDVSWEEACRKLVEAGFGEYVSPRFSTQSISALIRERENDGLPPVPEGLEDVLQVSEKYRVGARAAR